MCTITGTSGNSYCFNSVPFHARYSFSGYSEYRRTPSIWEYLAHLCVSHQPHQMMIVDRKSAQQGSLQHHSPWHAVYLPSKERLPKRKSPKQNRTNLIVAVRPIVAVIPSNLPPRCRRLPFPQPLPSYHPPFDLGRRYAHRLQERDM
jgi:hypothetical protein